jgi:hypothetical protein
MWCTKVSLVARDVVDKSNLYLLSKSAYAEGRTESDVEARLNGLACVRKADQV